MRSLTHKNLFNIWRFDSFVRLSSYLNMMLFFNGYPPNVSVWQVNLQSRWMLERMVALWVSDYSHRVSSRLILSHLSLPPECHHLVLIVLSLGGIETQSPVVSTTNTLHVCISDNLKFNFTFKLSWTRKRFRCQRLACISWAGVCVFQLAQNSFFSQKNLPPTVRRSWEPGPGPGLPDRGLEWRAQTTQSPG